MLSYSLPWSVEVYVTILLGPIQNSSHVETGTAAFGVSRNSLGIWESDMYVLSTVVYIYRDISKKFHVHLDTTRREAVLHIISAISMRNSATCSPSDDKFLACLYACGCRNSDSREYQ